jgi:excisionase family DNA binding protein
MGAGCCAFADADRPHSSPMQPSDTAATSRRSNAARRSQPRSHPPGCCLCDGLGSLHMSLSTPRGTTEVRLTPEPWPRSAVRDAGTADAGVDALGLLTVPEVANLLRLSEETVWRHMRSGEIESIKVGRARRITREALAAFVGSLKSS